jgi:hypothetical protein
VVAGLRSKLVLSQLPELLKRKEKKLLKRKEKKLVLYRIFYSLLTLHCFGLTLGYVVLGYKFENWKVYVCGV